jgi:hypothetical protein
MADVPLLDRSLAMAAAGVLPDHRRVRARVAVREDRHRGKARVAVLRVRARAVVLRVRARVVVLRGNPAAVGALRDRHRIVAAEVAMAVVATVGATKVATAAGTISSSRANRGLSPAAPLQAMAAT